MPTYTYRCTKCDTEYEVVQKMSDPPLKRCKKCRGALRRTFHPVGIVLKGAGFHRNDYKSSRSSGGSDRSEKSETKSDTKSETKSETKSDTKSDAGSGAGSTTAKSETSSKKGSKTTSPES